MPGLDGEGELCSGGCGLGGWGIYLLGGSSLMEAARVFKVSEGKCEGVYGFV